MVGWKPKTQKAMSDSYLRATFLPHLQYVLVFVLELELYHNITSGVVVVVSIIFLYWKLEVHISTTIVADVLAELLLCCAKSDHE